MSDNVIQNEPLEYPLQGVGGLVVGMASGLTIRSASKRAGITERTAGRWLAVPGFRQRVQEARAGLVERALGKLARDSTKAADTLRKLLDAGSDSIKLGAARALLELGNKLRESVALEERLALLEQALRDTKTGGSL